MMQTLRFVPAWGATFSMLLLLSAYALVLTTWVREADTTRASALTLHRHHMDCEALPRAQQRQRCVSDATLAALVPR